MAVDEGGAVLPKPVRRRLIFLLEYVLHRTGPLAENISHILIGIPLF